MFGFSLAELIVVFIVIIIFVKPQDLPEIARFLGKIYYKIRSFFQQIKEQLKEVEKEIGFDEIKQEINKGISEARVELEEKEGNFTTIIDIYGKEHKVPNISGLRSDLSKEELEGEISKYNKKNTKKSLKKTTKNKKTKAKTTKKSAKKIKS